MMDSPSSDIVDSERSKTSAGDTLVSSIITTIHSTVQDEVTVEDDIYNDRNRRIDSALSSLDASCIDDHIDRRGVSASSHSTDDHQLIYLKIASTDHHHTLGNNSHNYDQDVVASSSMHSTSSRKEHDTEDEDSQQSIQQPLTQSDLKSLVVNHILHVLNTGSYEEVSYCRYLSAQLTEHMTVILIQPCLTLLRMQ